MDMNKAFSDLDMSLVLFYDEVKWILASKRGRSFQYMMLGRTFEALMYRNSQLRRKYLGPQEMPKSPLDM